MIRVEEIPELYTAFRTRWEDRDARTLLIDQVVAGDWSAIGLDDEVLENRSPNLVQVALEDTAEAASLIPTVRVTPSGSSDLAKRKAAGMERLAISYMDLSQIELLTIKTLMDLCAFGYFCWVVQFDPETGSPVIEWRDPRNCYPEPGWRTMDSVRSCIFVRDLYMRQLPQAWFDKVAKHIGASEGLSSNTNPFDFRDREITLVEFYDEDETVVAAMYQSGVRKIRGGISMTPVELERVPNVGGVCPVVMQQRISLDGEPRGQFDQVVQVLQAHIRLMSMVLDYADQAVYSDVWVKDLVGQMSFGGGAYIQLGPQGAIGRVPPAVSSLAVEQQLEQLVSNIHLGGRWPKSRPGEIDQAIASAKFVEATAGMMNTVIRTLHLIMKRGLEQALRLCFEIDAELGADRTVAGVLRNQQFLHDRKKGDIDPKARLRVDYGIGLGRDPAQSMVLGIQGMQTGLFSKEFVQENFDGITDVARERQRIDIEALKDMAFAQLLQGLQAGSIPQQALIDIAKERANGADIFELFEKYIAAPQREAQDAMVPTGLGGPTAPVDPAAAGGGPVPPPPPGAEALFGMLGGPAGGPPGEVPGGPGGGGTEFIGRLSAPLPGGGFAGTQTTG